MTIEVDNMRQFFEGIVNQFNELTGTAQRVNELAERVNALNDRIGQLEAHNAQLARDLEQANEQVRQAQYEASQHRDAAIGANESIKVLQDTIVQSNDRVSRLADEAKNEADSHRITKADLEDARRASQEWEAKYVAARGDLDQVTDDRTRWQAEADMWRQRANDLQAKFDRLQSVLNPPTPYVVSDAGAA